MQELGVQVLPGARRGRGASTASPTVDPLTMTLAVARAFDTVHEVTFFDAGRRGVLPPAAARARMEAAPASEDAPGHDGWVPPAAVHTDSLRIDLAHEPGCAVVRLAGDLDLLDAARARETVVRANAPSVVVDLSGLSFLDAAGVGALVEARHQLQRDGKRLALRGAHGVVRRVLEITGLGEHLGEEA